MRLFEAFVDEMSKTAGDVIPFPKKMSPEEIRANLENVKKELSGIEASHDAQKVRLEQAAKDLAGHREKIEGIKKLDPKKLDPKLLLPGLEHKGGPPPRKFPWAKAGLGGAAGLTALVGGGLLLKKLLGKKKMEKSAVWKAPGRTSLSQSLPGKIPASKAEDMLTYLTGAPRLNLRTRLFGTPEVKARMHHASTLRETRKTEGHDPARRVLATARALAAGLPGTEGWMGQRAVEKAKMLARDAKDLKKREASAGGVAEKLRMLFGGKPPKKHQGSNWFEPVSKTLPKKKDSGGLSLAAMAPVFPLG